jgi:RimJ/RimL family protein N-acetyltransferase
MTGPDAQRIQPEPGVWQGRRVRLRAIEPEDGAVYFAWNRDDDQARGLWHVTFPQSAEGVRQWTLEESRKRPTGDAYRLVIEDERGEIVGDLSTHDCDPRVGTFSYGITIRRERRREGYAAEAIMLLLGYFFRELRYQKVTVRIFSWNTPSIQFHERLGFTLEGRIRRTVFTRGEHFDELVYGMTSEEFEALDQHQL